MLIRKEQMIELDKDFRHRFHQRLLIMFRAQLSYATKSLDDQAMLRRIAEADVKARSYGIVSERGIAQFAALSFIAGPKFDERPKAHRYLTYPQIEPHHKIATLFDYIVEHSR